LGAGLHLVDLPGAPLPSGIYMVLLRSSHQSLSKRMIVVN
jgi:hypothetical protein